MQTSRPSQDSAAEPLNFCLYHRKSISVFPTSEGCRRITHLMFASSLLIRFSSSSLALAFRMSAINCTNPRILALFPDEPRLKKPAAAELAMLKSWLSFPTHVDALQSAVAPKCPPPGYDRCESRGRSVPRRKTARLPGLTGRVAGRRGSQSEGFEETEGV